MSNDVKSQIRRRAVDGQLACEHAHAVAADAGVSIAHVVQLVNTESDLRYYRCQLGLFGYGSKASGQSKIVLPAAHTPPDIERVLEGCITQGAISCVDVWEIAERFAYPRLGMANIVEAMGIKVRPCQLGCF